MNGGGVEVFVHPPHKTSLVVLLLPAHGLLALALPCSRSLENSNPVENFVLGG